MNNKYSNKNLVQADETLQTPDKSITFNNQTQSSPFQISDMTPSTQLRFYQNQQQNKESTARTYTTATIMQNNNLGYGSHEYRDNTPKVIKEENIDNSQQQRYSSSSGMTPNKIARESQIYQNNNLNPHAQQQQQYNDNIIAEESRSSFSYFKALQGSPESIQTPGSKLANKMSFKDQEATPSLQIQSNQISPVQRMSHISPLIVRGDQDEMILLGNNHHNYDIKGGRQSKQQTEKVQMKQQQQSRKINKNLTSQQYSKQMVDRNKELKQMQNSVNNVGNESQVLNIKLNNNTSQQSNTQIHNLSNNISSDVEVWKYTNNSNRDQQTNNNQTNNKNQINTSFQDSDIADEFEYLYDPQYLNTRCMSPQTRLNYQLNNDDNENDHQKYYKRQSSNSPPNMSKMSKFSQNNRNMRMGQSRSGRKGMISTIKTQYGGEFMKGLEDYEKNELIKKTCKDSTKNLSINETGQDQFKKRKNNFISRMMIDKQLRDNREKTFDDIKYVVAMKTNMDHNSISRSVSPRKEQSQEHYNSNYNGCGDHTYSQYNHIMASPRSNINDRTSTTAAQTIQRKKLYNTSTSNYKNLQSPQTNQYEFSNQKKSKYFTNSESKELLDNNQSNLNLQAPQKKKLKKKDCIQIFNRLMQHEQGRQQAIEMLQEAKRKDEDAEYLQSTGNRKLTKKQKKQCYNRLVQDAERRKITKVQSQQQKELLQEQQIRDNQIFKSKKYSNANNNNSSSSSNIKKQKQNRGRQQELQYIENSREVVKLVRSGSNKQRSIEINVQQYYSEEQLQELDNEEEMMEQEYEDDDQYEEYLAQQEEEQNQIDQEQIVNIQAQFLKNLDSNNVLPASTYTSNSIIDTYIEENDHQNIYQKPMSISKPKFKMTSNAMNGAKQCHQQD